MTIDDCQESLIFLQSTIVNIYQMLLKLAFLIIFSYLLGSIPFGFIIVKFFSKKDIRKYGSGNIGMTNVSRLVGKTGGFIVLILDALKGFAATYLSYTMLPEAGFLMLLCPLAAVLGHIFPIMLKGKGGKGVATSLGIILYISPETAVTLLGIWAVSAAIFRISSIGSLLAALLLTPILYLWDCNMHELGLGAILTLIIFLTHIENIKRLLKGKELKI